MKVFQHFKTSLHGCRAASYSLYRSPLWSTGILVVWFTVCAWGKQRPEPNEAGVNTMAHTEQEYPELYDPKQQSWLESSTVLQLELGGLCLILKDVSARRDLYWYGVLNLHLPADGWFHLLTVPPSSLLTQHGQSGSGEWEHKSFELKWPQKIRTEQKEQRRSLKRKRENSRAEQREGDGSRAQRPGSELLVCLHSRAAAVSTSVAPSGTPPPPTHTPLSPHSPTLLSFYLPVVPFNNPGACWYAEQRWRV